ncbi:MAG: right-handed parallel beta-helix repeat-containing protein [Candidatus Marsarchaeota archaeon]|nr:right-handed parallel beta-helix repeat-containing protein [Candidatus Marsarchaeota archaeon]
MAESTDDNNRGGINIDVTPQSPVGPKQQPSQSQPQSPTQPQSQPQSKQQNGKKPLIPEYEKIQRPKDISFRRFTPFLHIIIAAVIVVVLVGAILFVVLPGSKATITTSSTTSIPSVVSTKTLSACGVIASPGAYYISNNIRYVQQQGSCINVTSSNVSVICNGMNIMGSGPFTNVSPYSYGIYASGIDNLSISGCTISNFSYGVYTGSVSHLDIIYDNLSTNYVLNAYLGNDTNSTVTQSSIYNGTSPQGAIAVVGGSGDLFSNNTLRFNNHYGFSVDSSGDRFINNIVSGSQVSFVCYAQNGFKDSNYAFGNTCFNQSGCEFLSCQGNNAPLNLTQITLSKGISTCGTISSGGIYSLNSDINVLNYLNVSHQMACLNINSNNVMLQCNGHTISNAYVGISSSFYKNVTVKDCNINNSYKGIQIDNVTLLRLNNTHFSKDDYSVYMVNTGGAVVTGVNAFNGTYGLYLSGTAASIFKNFSLQNNKYGAYLTSSLGNIFSGGVSANNTKYDFYATSDSTNVSADIMSGTVCGVSDTQWSTCAQFVNTTSYTFPISSCGSIKRPGSYSLTQNLLNSPSTCIRVNASDVSLTCDNHEILASSPQNGPAIFIDGKRNVTIANCTVSRYYTGIGVYNSSRISISGVSASPAYKIGIVMENVTSSTLENSTFNGTDMYGMDLTHVTNSSIEFNNISIANKPEVGVFVNSSTRNKIIGNNGKNNYVGMEFTGTSNNNTVSNNIFTASSYIDYTCSSQNGGLGAESGGENFGTSKSGCTWMAVVPSTASPLPCFSSAGGTQLYSLLNDYVYYGGLTCFSLVTNYSTINCNGHTILATNGGTFAKVLENVHGTAIENCNLKGFSTPIVVYGASSTIRNNTIYDNYTNKSSSTPDISIVNATNMTIMFNNILHTADTGIFMNKVHFGQLENNNVSALTTAYYLNNVTAMSIQNDTSSSKSGLGMVMLNSTINIFQQNNFYGTSGLICSGRSDGPANNTDSGSNYCSTMTGCGWIRQSLSIC